MQVPEQTMLRHLFRMPFRQPLRPFHPQYQASRSPAPVCPEQTHLVREQIHPGRLFQLKIPGQGLFPLLLEQMNRYIVLSYTGEKR